MMFLCFSNPNSGSGCRSSMRPCRMSSQPLAPTNVASFSTSMDQGVRHSSISFESTICCMICVLLCKQRIGLLSTTSNPPPTSLTKTHNIFASEHVWRMSLPMTMTHKSETLLLGHSNKENKSLISHVTNRPQTTQQRWRNAGKETLLQLLKKCQSNCHL